MCEGDDPGEQGRSTVRSRQLFPDTSWALALNRLMENMSKAPSQGGWLGRAFVGLAGIWSLERGTERPRQSRLSGHLSPSPYFSEKALCSPCGCWSTSPSMALGEPAGGDDWFYCTDGETETHRRGKTCPRPQRKKRPYCFFCPQVGAPPPLTPPSPSPTPVLELCGRLLPSLGRLWRGWEGWAWSSLEDTVPYPCSSFERAWQLTRGLPVYKEQQQKLIGRRLDEASLGLWSQALNWVPFKVTRDTDRPTLPPSPQAMDPCCC